MIILEDVLQQADKHKIKHDAWRKMGVQWNRCRLTCGDYQLPNDGSIAVDSKYGISELETDFMFRAKSKKDIKFEVYEIFRKFNIPFENQAELMYHLIVDDDADRFPEKEISDFCYEHGITERALKLFQDLYVKRHGFFHRGLIRAKQYGIQLYIVVDNVDGVYSINDLFKWSNPRRKIMVRTNEIIGYNKNGTPKYKRVQKYPNCIMGEQLAKACITMQNKYGCKFLFCRPEDSAELILSILTKDKS